jgi:DNA modification methylase
MAYLTPGSHAHVFPRKVNTGWKPVIIYCQGEYEGERYGDVVKSDASDKDHHPWDQSVSGMRELLRRFVMPGHVVVDPFLGGGTTAVVALELGATFLGFDISQDAIDATRARLAISTQPAAELRA